MSSQRKTVLVAPLDWGLGHATRCMPVIDALQSHGYDVLIGGSGTGLQLLKHRFPHLTFIDLPSYNITYPRKGSMAIHLMLRLPSLLRTIKNEKRLLHSLLHQYPLAAVISDNRYGLYHSDVKSIFMTHQVHIRSGIDSRVADGWLFRMHRKFLSHFDRIWIVDEPSHLADSLAGEMSSSRGLDIPHDYIGWLSRFSLQSAEVNSHEKPYDRVAMLSGPEPQRTILEQKLWTHFKTLPGRSLIVRGTEGEDAMQDDGVETINGIADSRLVEILRHRPLFYARPGYSTIMDLLHLGHGRAVFIPTPGQTEQAYLAKLLSEKHGFTCVDQNAPLPDESLVTTGRWPLPQASGLLAKCVSELTS